MRSFLTAILTRYARQHIKSFNNVLYLMKSNTILHCFRIKKKVPNILELLHEDFIPAVLFHRYMVDIYCRYGVQPVKTNHSVIHLD